MSDYINSVKQNLSRLDDEEIVQKIKNNSLTDDAKAVAEEVLRERGFDVNNPESVKKLEVIDDASFTDDKVIKRGFQTSNVSIWICTLFLLGISQHISMPYATHDSPANVVVKIFMGISWAVLGGIFVSIYSYLKRNMIITKEDIVRKYRSNIKSIIFINFFLGVIIALKLITGYSSIVALLDIAVIFGLTYAIYKRVKSAKGYLAVYAIANPVLFTLLGASGTSGILWAFVFLATAQSMLIESTFDSLNLSLEN
jgi:hypothetical protein